MYSLTTKKKIACINCSLHIYPFFLFTSNPISFFSRKSKEYLFPCRIIIKANTKNSHEKGAMPVLLSNPQCE